MRQLVLSCSSEPPPLISSLLRRTALTIAGKLERGTALTLCRAAVSSGLPESTVISLGSTPNETKSEHKAAKTASSPLLPQP